MNVARHSAQEVRSRFTLGEEFWKHFENERNNCGDIFTEFILENDRMGADSAGKRLLMAEL